MVLITRETDYEMLLARHATKGQARFFLRTRHQSTDEVERRHLAQQAAVTAMRAALPREWRIVQVRRAELDRFMFAPEDVVVAVGQDGLVANVAKYLSGQPVIGVNPEPDRNPGILVQHGVDSAIRMLEPAAAGRVATEDRTMLRAELDSGQALLALNEVFVGHATHQSARYVIAYGKAEEAQSSSGLIVASGTGATGWALSIGRATGTDVGLAPTARAAVFLVREPWPSQATGATITAGQLGAGEALRIVSRMNENGVVFADGMEQDRLAFGWGASLAVSLAEQRLRLVPAEGAPARPVLAAAAVPRRAPATPRPAVAAPARAVTGGVARPAPGTPKRRGILGLVFLAVLGLVGLNELADLIAVATGFASGTAVVTWPAGTWAVGLLALPLIRLAVHLKVRPVLALCLGVALAVGLGWGAAQLVSQRAASAGYARCALLDTAGDSAAAYAQPGRCRQ